MPTQQRHPSISLISAYTALLSVLVTTLLGTTVSAAQVTVTSDEGLPLKDAVVEVYYDSAAVRHPPQEQSIYQRDAAFHPRVLTISTESYVTFPNRDNTRHHVYSFSAAKTFDLNLYLQETPPPVYFDQAGTVILGCNIHDHMQAFIVVSDAPYAETTDAKGQLALPTLPPGEHRIRVWHPDIDDSHQMWWEGVITEAEVLEVSLELNAVPLPTPTHSPLQQRFKDAS